MSIDNAASLEEEEAGKLSWRTVPPRTLIIDHHDSYTLNLLPLLLHALQPDSSTAPTEADATLLSSRLLVLPHTHALLEPTAFAKHLAPYLDALILSPGPGNSQREADFGVATRLIQAAGRTGNVDLPTLGVCLGHQGIATALGASVKRTRGVRHGVTSALCWSEPGEMRQAGKGIFQGVPEGVQVVRYNSLTVDEATLPSSLCVTAWAFDPVSPAPAPCPEAHARLSQGSLPPFASSSSGGSAIPASEERVILALQHCTRPLWGVQFHPESIESSNGAVILRNFVRETRRFWHRLADSGQAEAAHRVKAWDAAEPLPAQLRRLGGACVAHSLASCAVRSPSFSSSSAPASEFCIVERRLGSQLDARAAPDVFQRLFRGKGAGNVWLDSARPGDPANRFSYMASPAFSLSYEAETQCVRVRRASQHQRRRRKDTVEPLCISLKGEESGLVTPSASRGASPTTTLEADTEVRGGRTFWQWFNALQADLARRTRRMTHAEERFSAGWTGYFGYELGAESMDLPRVRRSAAHEAATSSGMFTPPLEEVPAHAQLQDVDSNEALPDAHFGFCQRVLSLDHQTGEWIATALIKLDNVAGTRECSPEYKSLQGALGEALSELLGQTESQAQEWFEEVEATLAQLASDLSAEPIRALKSPRLESPRLVTSSVSSSSSNVSLASLAVLSKLKPRDSPALYRAKVEAARAHIAQGESYELCLTTQFQGYLAPPCTGAEGEAEAEAEAADLDHFGLYCALRRKNPAPYAAFLCLANPTNARRTQSLLSTSPERFMSVDAHGWVEMKPIKGTLARAGWGKGEEHMRKGSKSSLSEREKAEWRCVEDRKRAESLKADVKERAENLMIVDLIRADLLSFCAPHTVSVPRLMQVETYETVHQLVTTVRGRIAHASAASFSRVSASASGGSETGAEAERDRGMETETGTGTVEAIRRCFPPGSMTGAPKRRSVHLLARLEAERGESESNNDAMPNDATAVAKRGVYSGALGWIGLNEAASFSVVIRTVVANASHLSLGAGGAVTYLSSAEREWEEVGDKVAAFGVPKY